MKLKWLVLETKLKLKYYKITRWIRSWFCNHKYVPCVNWKGTWSMCEKCYKTTEFMSWS